MANHQLRTISRMLLVLLTFLLSLSAYAETKIVNELKKESNLSVDSKESLTLVEALETLESDFPDEVKAMQRDYEDFINYADEKLQGKQVSLGRDVLEIGKIMGMGVVAAVLFGITHDLITTNINFDYFASDRTPPWSSDQAIFPLLKK